MRTIENDIPEELVELARDAMELGLYSVNLGFRYLSSDFASPTEWALSLHKIEPDNRASERNWLSVTAMRGDDGPTAYIPSKDPDSWGDGAYWNTDQVRAWLTQTVEGDPENEYSQSWGPATEPEAREYFLQQWPLFLEGARSGWTMERKIRWRDHLSFRNILAEHGPPVDSLPSAALEWSMTNSFYNRKGHPDHRSTGAPLSVGGFSIFNSENEIFFNHGTPADGHRPVKQSRAEVEATLGATAPWFVRVAGYDGAEERWTQFPEALEEDRQSENELEESSESKES